MTSHAALWRAIACSFALVSLLVPATGAGQSLGEVARQEQERRKMVSSTSKVYTTDTLKPDPSSPTVPPPASASDAKQASPADAQPAATTDVPEQEGADRTKDERFWRDRIQTERDALQRAEMFAEALQSRINALSADFTARDDPAQRTRVAADREKALAELTRVQQEVQQHTKNIKTIEEEARRAGVPAGWVR